MSEHRWILAVAARCALYSFSLGVSFLLLGAILFGLPTSFLFWFALGNPEFADVGRAITAVIFLAGALCLVITAIGLAGGAIAGFYSPPQEPPFPFQSPFFRQVLKNGVGGFCLGALFGLATGILCSSFVGNGFGMAITLFLAFCSQIYGLGRGLNRARHAAPTLPPESV